MKRIAVLLYLGVLSTAACSAARSLGVSTSSSSTAPAAGLSEYATRFIRDTNALAQDCPAGPKPAASYESQCVGRADSAENLYKAVEDKANAQVARGHAYLGALRTSIARWRSDDKEADARDVASQRAARDTERAEHNASELIGQLKGGRDGKAPSLLTSFDHRDAEYVERRVDMLRKQMPALETIAKSCGGGAGDKELCDLAIHREKYFTAMQAVQFDAILADRLEAWTTTVELMKSEGKVAVINYNTLTKPDRLAALGSDLAEIGRVLAQANPRAKIDGKLARLRDDFVAAVRDKQRTHAWAAHASGAKYQDPAISKAVRDISGLSMVRVGATQPTWTIIRGALDQPVQRNHGIWALMKKPGDSFCRLYQFTVVEDHLGGGRYGAPRADSFGAPEFFVSSCK